MSRPPLFTQAAALTLCCAINAAQAQDNPAAYARRIPTITLQDAKALLANYPFADRSEQIYNEAIQACTQNANAGSPAKSPASTPAAAPGFAGMLGGLMNRNAAVGTDPNAMKCAAKAEEDHRREQAAYIDNMPPEAAALKVAVAETEACIRKTLQTRGVVLRGQCQSGPTTRQGDIVAVPNRGQLYGGATHAVVLIYSPGDETRLDAAQ